jgi:hypothetical protein
MVIEILILRVIQTLTKSLYDTTNDTKNFNQDSAT